jgi:hypothetical protein
MMIAKKIKLWWWKRTHVIEPIKITDTKVETINVVKQYNPRKFSSMSNEELADDLAYDIGRSALKNARLICAENQFNDTIEVRAQVKVVAR